jgi:TPR repeat protein
MKIIKINTVFMLLLFISAGYAKDVTLYEQGMRRYDEGDYSAAHELFVHDNGSAANVMLGNMYKNGIRVKQDHKIALKYFIYAADQGNAYAQFATGIIYLGVVKDKIGKKLYHVL